MNINKRIEKLNKELYELDLIKETFKQMDKLIDSVSISQMKGFEQEALYIDIERQLEELKKRKVINGL